MQQCLSRTARLLGSTTARLLGASAAAAPAPAAAAAAAASSGGFAWAAAASSSGVGWAAAATSSGSGAACLRSFAADATQEGCKRLYVGNLSWGCKAEDLANLFGKYGGVQDCMIPLDNLGRSRGYGFVELDEAGASAAIAGLHEQEFMGRNLIVNEARPRPERGEERPRRRRGYDRGGYDRGGGYDRDFDRGERQ